MEKSQDTISQQNYESNSTSNQNENDILDNSLKHENKKKGCERKIKIIIVLACLLLIILIVMIFLILISRAPADNENFNKFDNNKRFFKISSLFFNSSKKEYIKTNLEDISNNNKIRRLEENENIKEIKSEFLFTIVSEPNLENEYYEGYVIILSRKEILNDVEKTFFNESNNINEDDKNFKGVMKVIFKDNGTIVDRLYQSNLSPNL